MRKIFLLSLTVFLAVLAGASASGAVEYDGAWMNNDGDVNFLSSNAFLGGTNPYPLFLYDWGDSSADLEILPEGGISSTVYFGQDGLGTWYASLTNIKGGVGTPGPGMLELGPNTWFGLYFLDEDTEVFSYDLSVIQAGKIYGIIPDLDGAAGILVTDVQLVPLPGAFWLLGSGLLGLVAVRKRLFG